MILAADYPFLDILWSMIIFFAWVVWIWMMVVILTDVFRRSDIGGWAKAGWTAFMIILPFIGALTYIITQGQAMADRRTQDVKYQQEALDSHIRSVAGSSGNGDSAGAEIERAKRLLDSGAIDQSEYDALKRRVLAA
jgi:hypothetical protein